MTTKFGFHGLEVTTKLRVSWVRGEKKLGLGLGLGLGLEVAENFRVSWVRGGKKV